MNIRIFIKRWSIKNTISTQDTRVEIKHDEIALWSPYISHQGFNDYHHHRHHQTINKTIT
ncbi:hypothetical protein DERP_009164 [Dermatophagoides pteronyssinus]|uniref:Uncharacterized protein n=1 Tax=Dermatophagoides pteronyssinus TaxID=6956 RepID=A0ABQ8JQQ5_DERPT|nr:hypothetical protein DERP_009164 [Dermatophagoides pteronyssinus]